MDIFSEVGVTVSGMYTHTAALELTVYTHGEGAETGSSWIPPFLTINSWFQLSRGLKIPPDEPREGSTLLRLKDPVGVEKVASVQRLPESMATEVTREHRCALQGCNLAENCRSQLGRDTPGSPGFLVALNFDNCIETRYHASADYTIGNVGGEHIGFEG
ncbi:hypothetical protein BJ165DRAFT_1407207 [Panaeolus papilionaceus]|nr:hypothetical protein BJ165DRAFT_1407207 [Panaeolus papilionaceus]